MVEAGKKRGDVYRGRVSRLGTRELCRMYDVLCAGDNLPGWPPGRALEYLVLRAFQLEGAKVTWPYEVRHRDVLLEQVDGAVYCDGLTCLIETKAYAQPLDYLPVSRMKARLLRRPRTVLGAVFTLEGFTEAFVLLAETLPPPDVLLWSGKDIAWALRRRAMRTGLRRKHRYAIEHGFPHLPLTQKEGTS